MSKRSSRVSRADFPLVLREGKRVPGKLMTLIYDPRRQGNTIVVSKKVAKTAVRRNKIRRAIRAVLTGVPSADGASIVLVSPGASHSKNSELRAELETLRRRITLSI